MVKFIIMEQVKIRILDFTEDPGPRYIRQDKEGETTSGEAFYVNVLNTKFKECYESKKLLILVLDGVSGYPSSFLDEAIGELVYDFSRDIVEKYLNFETKMYKKRVEQVKDETYPQWEKRRLKVEKIVHSPNINKDIYCFSTSGELITKHIP